jgi:hypothetical protein
MDLGGTGKVRQWWGSLGIQNQIALLGLVVALLAAVPGYLALRGSRGDGGPSPTLPLPNTSVDSVAGATSTSRVRPKGEGALKLAADYHWTTDSIMWALPKQLTSEDSKLVEGTRLIGDIPAQRRLEALLGQQDGVKLAVDSTAGSREHSQLRLIVTGQHTSTVLITNMRANITKRERPLSETVVFGPPQGEGLNIQIGFDLDSLRPIARAFDTEQNLAGPYFASKHISVKPGEQVVFEIRAFTDKCYCEWEILIDAVVDGKDQVFAVKDGPRPFRTTAFADAYRTIYEFDFAADRFVRRPPGTRFQGDSTG